MANETYRRYFRKNKAIYLEYWARRKGRGYISVNEYFEGSDGHHIDNEQVVYVPTFIHRSIPHHQKDMESMYLMNLWALFWLVYGDPEYYTEMKIPNWVFKDTTKHTYRINNRKPEHSHKQVKLV